MANKNGSTASPQPLADLTIPKEYVEPFLLAAAGQMQSDAKSVLGEDKKCRTFEVRHADDKVKRARMEDLATSKKCALASARVFVAAADAAEATPDQDITITGDTGELDWAVQEMAREVVVPRLAEEADTSPLDAALVGFLTGALNWTLKESQRLERLAGHRVDEAVAV
jgi:hypothetical protein